MAALPELRQYQIVHGPAGLHVLVQVRDGVDAQEVSRRIERELSNKLLAVGVVSPHLDVTVVDEIPREHGISELEVALSQTSPQRARSDSLAGDLASAD